MLVEMGFDLNETKTHFITNAGRQSVTGLTVNEKVSVPAGYKRLLRQEIYYALRFGLADSILRGGRAVLRTDGVPDTERYRQQLLGRIQYVLQIEPGNRWFREAKQSCCPAMTSRRSDACSLITAWAFRRRRNRITYILRLATNAK